MAKNWEELNNKIKEQIRQNSVQSITGDVLQGVMLDMTGLTEDSISKANMVNLSDLDNMISFEHCGVYKVMSENGLTIGMVINTTDSGLHVIDQWLFTNINIKDGVLSNLHTDSMQYIYKRIYNKQSSMIYPARGKWSDWGTITNAELATDTSQLSPVYKDGNDKLYSEKGVKSVEWSGREVSNITIELASTTSEGEVVLTSNSEGNNLFVLEVVSGISVKYYSNWTEREQYMNEDFTFKSDLLYVSPNGVMLKDPENDRKLINISSGDSSVYVFPGDIGNLTQDSTSSDIEAVLGPFEEVEAAYEARKIFVADTLKGLAGLFNCYLIFIPINESEHVISISSDLDNASIDVGVIYNRTNKVYSMNGSSITEYITTYDVVDDLNATDKEYPLSANQGRILNEKIPTYIYCNDVFNLNRNSTSDQIKNTIGISTYNELRSILSGNKVIFYDKDRSGHSQQILCDYYLISNSITLTFQEFVNYGGVMRCISIIYNSSNTAIVTDKISRYLLITIINADTAVEYSRDDIDRFKYDLNISSVDDFIRILMAEGDISLYSEIYEPLTLPSGTAAKYQPTCKAQVGWGFIETDEGEIGFYAVLKNLYYEMRVTVFGNSDEEFTYGKIECLRLS